MFYASDFCAERSSDERKIEFEFFLKKDLRFLFVSSLGNSFALEGLEEKKMKATPLILGGLESSSSPRLLAVFAGENSWSRSLKKAQKNECVVVSSQINTRESGTRIPQSALRFVLRII